MQSIGATPRVQGVTHPGQAALGEQCTRPGTRMWPHNSVCSVPRGAGRTKTEDASKAIMPLASQG